MSLPTSSGVSPAASAAAPPPVDPPGVRAGSHGFTVRPKIGLSACQSARTGGTFVLPTTTAPALRTRVVAGASWSETKRDHSGTPTVVRGPVTLIASFSVIGRPRSGPSSPRARAVSAASAWRRARSKSRVTMAFRVPSWRAIRTTWSSSSSTAETRRPASARSMSPAVVNGSSFAVVIVRSPLRSWWTGSQRADRAEHDLALADRVRLGGREREKRRVDAGGQIPTDVSADLVRRAADDQVVDDLLGYGRDRPLAVAALPRVPHRPERRGAPEPLVERPVDGHVEVGGHVTPHRRLRRGPRWIDVDEEACRDLDRPGIAPGAGSGLAHDGDGLRHVVGGEPVQDRAVADLARDPQHPGPERCDVDGDRLDGRFGQAKAVHRERLAAEDDALARERPAEELRRLAHAGRGTGEGAAVPRHAVHLERPRVGVPEPLGLARELGVLGEREAVERHRQGPALRHRRAVPPGVPLSRLLILLYDRRRRRKGAPCWATSWS